MKRNICKGLCVLASSVFVIALSVGSILENNASMVDDALGTQSTQIITDDDADLYTFKVGEKYNTTEKFFNEMKDLATRMQREGTVLLKNENTALPMADKAKVTLLGGYSHAPAYGGNMHGPKPSQKCSSLEDSLKEIGFEVNPVMVNAYESYFMENPKGKPNKLPTSMSNVYNFDNAKYRSNEQSVDTIATYASSDVYQSFREYNDAAIVVFGRPTAEAGDYFTGEKGTVQEEGGSANSLGLTANERSLLTTAKANFDKVIVLINADNLMEIGEIKDDPDIDAIVWVGMYGQYGTRGVAEVLRGRTFSGEAVSPSGGLMDIHVYDNSSHPADENFGIQSYSNYLDVEAIMPAKPFNHSYQVQLEGIYNGYRYFETRYYDAVMGDSGARSGTGAKHSENGWKYEEEVTYGFGYGLSYTEFDYKLESVEMKDNEKTAVVKGSVTNTGDVDSKTPIQIYVQMPYIKGGIEKSAIQLADFQKSDVIKAGATYNFTMEVDMSYVASYDEKNAKSYYMDPGDYYFAIGNGAHEALNNILALQGKTPENTDYYMDAKGNSDAAKVVKNAYEGNEDVFSVSKAGVEVKNLFDSYNVNNYDLGKKVTYLSRSDWDGTYPEPVVGLTASKEVIQGLSSQEYQITENGDPSEITFCKEWQKGIKYADMKGAEYDDPRWKDFLSQMKLSEVLNTVLRGNGQVYGMEAVSSFDSWAVGDSLGPNNAIGAKSDPNDPVWNGKDPKEDPYAGEICRCIPTEPVIGATFNKELAEEQGVIFGVSSIYTDQTVIWGPCVTPHRGTGFGRISENYSEDPVVNGMLGAETSRVAWEDYGCIVTFKHFALNNIETNRVGLATFGNEQGLREIELRSFQVGFEGGGTGLMSAFNRVGLSWASANETLLIDLLRVEWGWRGYAITDIVTPSYEYYMSAKDAIMGGSNIFDNTSAAYYESSTDSWGYFAESELDKLKKDKTFMDRLEANTHELMYMMVNSNAMNGIGDNTKKVWLFTWWRGAYIGLEVISMAGAVVCAGLFAFDIIRNSRKVRKEDNV